MPDLRTAAAVRRACRCGDLAAPTPGLGLGFVQANLAVVPRDLAFDFLLFCQRNPKPCPLLDVTSPGSWRTRLAPGADLRTDLPAYRVYVEGTCVAEVTDASPFWRDDLVAFHGRYYRPQNVKFVVSGDITPAVAQAKLEAAFGIDDLGKLTPAA